MYATCTEKPKHAEFVSIGETNMGFNSTGFPAPSVSLEDYGLSSSRDCLASGLVNGARPVYSTRYGAAFLGNALGLLKGISDESVNLILTSPPYALVRKKPYGNENASRYVGWFLPFASEFKRILTADGSLVVDIGGAWTKGLPTKSTYQFELLLALTKSFHLAQDFYWCNPARLPSPAEWVNVRRIRVKDAVDCIWWLAKSPFPKADNRAVLRPYSDSMRLLLSRGVTRARRPSGHEITQNFERDNSGSIPPNFLLVANTDSMDTYLRGCRRMNLKPHPARFPQQIPEFFIRMLTEKSDLVLDPFAGSNTTGAAAESLKRRWIAFEIDRDYLGASRLRFLRR
jgi:site-specific DNA-methyltransferase (cytosine-N4-specific)